MNKIINIIVILFILVSKIFGSSNKLQLNLNSDFIRQFESLVKFNELNNKRGESYKNNYIFVYEKGKIFNPLDLTTTDWIFENPNEVFLSGNLSTYYHDQLNLYNNKPTLEDPPQYYQHYVIVYKLDLPNRSEFAQNLIQQDEIKNVIIYSDGSNNETQTAIYNDEDWYDAKTEELVQSIKSSIVWNTIFSHFPGSNQNYHNYITLATVENKLHGISEDPSNPYSTTALKVNTTVRIRGLAWESDQNFFNNRLSQFHVFENENYPGIGLNRIAQRIKAFIHYFNYETINGGDCNEIALELATTEARLWLEQKCIQFENYLYYQDAKELITKSAEFIDYYYYLKNNYSSSVDIDGTIIKINSIINEYKAQNISEHKPYLNTKWNAEPDKTDFIRFYYQSFFDLNSLSIQSIVDNFGAYVSLIDKNASYWNYILSNITPTPLSKYRLKRFNVEIGWNELNDIFKKLANGPYSKADLNYFIGKMKLIGNIREFIWKKVLNGNGLGIEFYGVSSNEIANNLAKFLIKAQIDDQPAISSNVVIWDISEKYSAFGITKDYITSRKVIFSADYMTGSIKVSYCPNYKYICNQYAAPGYVQSCFVNCETTPQELQPVTDLDFFDIVYLTEINNPLFLENIGGNSSPPDINHKGHPVPLFFIKQKLKDQKEAELLKTIGIIIQVGVTVYSGGVYLTAAAGVQRLIAGIWFFNNLATFYVQDQMSDSDFTTHMENLFGPGIGTDIAAFVKTLNIVISLSEGFSLTNLEKKFTSAQQYKAIAISRLMDDLVKNADLTANQQAQNFRLMSLGKNLKEELFIKYPQAESQILETYYGLFGAGQNLHNKIQSSSKLRDYIIKFNYSNSSNLVSVLSPWNESKLNKLLSVIENNTPVLDYLGGTLGQGMSVSSIIKNQRLGSWSDLYDAGRYLSGTPPPSGSLIMKTDAIEGLLIAKNNINRLDYGITNEYLALFNKNFNWSGSPASPSYVESIGKLNSLLTVCDPTITNNMMQYLGAAGFNNSSQWVVRHSWVQLNRLSAPSNLTKLENASEIVFERATNVGGLNSVSDVHIKVGTDVIEIETKAGTEFFDSGVSSNFLTQSKNSLLIVNRIENYKVFLREDIRSSAGVAQRDAVVNAWYNDPNGILGNSVIQQKFADYWGVNISEVNSSLKLKTKLSENMDWFDDIFKNDF